MLFTEIEFKPAPALEILNSDDEDELDGGKGDGLEDDDDLSEDALDEEGLDLEETDEDL